ncbi:TOX high mobility group box family member 4b isoform X2 [Amia ocellicauda]|uniref:TOX high mobility group box family member 4b isoform X2 n=1 Tax=Amia ocellicauda TaxID=2972642 RepID=UPI0034647D41
MEFPGGSDNYLTISGAGHPFLSSSETFHTPSLGDEEFEIPPISLDPDSTLAVSDVVGHFADLQGSGAGGGGSVGGGGGGGGAGGGVGMVGRAGGGGDPSFSSPFTPPSQGLEHLSMGVITQPGGAMLSSTLSMDLGHSIGSQFSSSSPMTIDVPLSDINHGLLGHGQLTTIDQSELSAQLGLSLGGGTILPRPQSPDDRLSATPSPAGSLQDDDADDYRQCEKRVLVESPVSVSPAVISLSPVGDAVAATSALSLSSSSVPSSSAGHVHPPPPSLTAGGLRRGGAGGAGGGGGGGKKGKKKKDPNEPQKPVSAYALFFRDTQAAIKGQNPNATFGEVSKIVASMWDSLGEEQKQVYKRKTEAAKKEYLKALAAYRANQLSQTTIEVMDTEPSPPPPVPIPQAAPPPAPLRSPRIPHNAPNQNTITNICTSNIILDHPQVITRSRTGAHPSLTAGKSPGAASLQSSAPPLQPSVSAAAAHPPTVTKIIISKQMLAGSGHQIPTSVVTVIPATRILQQNPALSAAGASTVVTGPSRPPMLSQPPPLQQMQQPPPPRLQQMVHSQAPPPLQAKPRGGAGMAVSVTTAPPPPLQIKIVPAPLQAELAAPIIVTSSAGTAPVTVVQAAGPASSVASPPAMAVEVAQSACSPSAAEEAQEAEEFTAGAMEVELSVSPPQEEAPSPPPSRCVRAGCTNPPVDSKDWDREYCSNECVATHCRDIFMAWCSLRGQGSTTTVT